MLRSIVKNRHLVLASKRSVSHIATEPSTTTTVILKNLSPSLTETSLKAAIAEINCRKIEMEPGCSIHVKNEAEANYVQSLVSSKFGYHGQIASTSLPSLLLENLPASVCADGLEKAFSSFGPKMIRMIGSSSIQVTMKSAEETLIAEKLISKIMFNEKGLKTHAIKLPDNTFAVLVSNFHSSVSTTTASKAISDALSGTFSEENILLKTVPGAVKSASLRFKTTNPEEVEAITAALGKVYLNGQLLSVSAPKRIKKPSLFIRNVRQIGGSKLAALMSQMGCERLRINDRTKDQLADLAVAFYPTEEAAFQALHKLKNIRIEGVKILASFREVAEPAVTISNLPVDYTEAQVWKLFELFKPVRVEVTNGESETEALVVLGGPADVDLAVNAMSRKKIDGTQLKVVASPVHDTGVDIILPEDVAGEPAQAVTTSVLFNALQEAGVTKPKGIAINTNISAFLSFLTIQEAVTAHTSFMEGGTVLDSSNAAGSLTGGLVTSHISAHPSYVVEVSGLQPETPYSSIVSALQGIDDEAGAIGGDREPLTVDCLRIDRSAIVKFKKAGDVVFNMKKLRSMTIDGNKLKVTRFRPVVKLSDNEIDEVGSDETFDQYALMNVMKDYMYADQATRYQVVRNHFERAVQDAKNTKNHTYIVDDQSTPTMVAEAKKLLSMPAEQAMRNERLFELYIQRQDLNMFVHDFRDSEAFFGPADASDPFDWSTFMVEDYDDVLKYKELYNDAENRMITAAHVAAGTEPKISNNQRKRELIIKGMDGDQTQAVSLEDVSQLTDKNGRVWSGAILDSDQVQKPMPGGRVMSYRALVVVGNLRGAAGYGMGKAKTPADAVVSAFRDALRNLVFVDLYDQFGFAHDLHGKHNSCHAYIKATDRNRMMVGSPFATAVLERFGVGSASVKLVGRRDPYAMVRALFDAVAKHENIDEFAKDRGRRYLTIKWLYENKI